MKYLIIILTSQLLFINNIQSVTAEEVLLVVPKNTIGGIGYGIKITRDNMAVRKFEKNNLKNNYLTPNDFNRVINKTVSKHVPAGEPIPYDLIIPLWKQFSSAEGAFSVMMPGTPVLNNTEENQQTGVYYFEVEQGNDNLKQGSHSYMIGYMNLSPENSTGPGARSLLTTLRNTSVKTLTKRDRTIKQLNEDNISLKGYSGFEIKAMTNNGEYDLFTTQRTYKVENRMYTLLVISPYNPTPEMDVQKFLQSFSFSTH